MFAKIFEYDRGSQILVKKDADEDGNPEVRLYFEPESLGVCSYAFKYKDTDEGWDSMDLGFDAMTKEVALGIVRDIESKIYNSRG